jgi:hypothetical protein
MASIEDQIRWDGERKRWFNGRRNIFFSVLYQGEYLMIERAWYPQTGNAYPEAIRFTVLGTCNSQTDVNRILDAMEEKEDKRERENTIQR